MAHRDYRVSQAAMEQRQNFKFHLFIYLFIFTMKAGYVVCISSISCKSVNAAISNLSLELTFEGSVFTLQGDRGRDGIPGIPGLQGPPVRKRQLMFHTSSSFLDCLAVSYFAQHSV